MTQLFYASTLFGAMTLAAAMDDGVFGPHRGRRMLLVSNNAAIPETIPPLDEAPGFAALRRRFDEVRSWNEIIAPLHPSEWRARMIEAPMLSRLLRSHLSLDDDLDELVVESVAVAPARTIAGLVRDCPITVYSDGLMSYGPTRGPLPGEIAGRIVRLLHLDLVPGLAPLLLTEYDVPARVVPDRAFLRVVDEVGGTEEPEPQGAALAAAETGAYGTRGGTAMILGQYLSALGIVTEAEETALYTDMLRAVAARGHRFVVFKAHPAADRRHARELRETASALGVRLAVVDRPIPAESSFASLRPELVVGCFSTGLITAQRHFGLAVATMGTDLVLDRLTPYENSNRVPLTIVDALLPRLGRDGSLEEPPPADVTGLVRAVGYCMQSEAHPGLRVDAAAHLDAHGPERYFTQRRLVATGLAPAPPVSVALGRLRGRLARTAPPGQPRRS